MRENEIKRCESKWTKEFTREIQKVKIFLKINYILSKISPNVFVLILETLLRLDLYTRETYESGALIQFGHNPKMGVMTLALSHQDKSTYNSIVTIICGKKNYNQLKNTSKTWLSRV